jgi:hypothetical protein
MIKPLILRFRRTLTIIQILFCMAAWPAMAQTTRTWVSGVGDDANPCSRTAPCKTFAGAIAKTAAGGEISVLDPGGYGAVTITKSITLNGEGTLASIQSASVNGVIVNAAATDKVILRNIQIIAGGATLGINGIRFLAGAQLTVENVSINGFTTHGIDVALAASGRVFVKNTNITECGGAGFNISTTAGNAIASLEKVSIEGNVNGVVAGSGNTLVHVQRSSITSNTGNGLLASGANSMITLENSTLANNGNGVYSSLSGATIRLSGNGIYNNDVGIIFTVGGVVASDGTNRMAGNASSAAPNATIVRQ